MPHLPPLFPLQTRICHAEYPLFAYYRVCEGSKGGRWRNNLYWSGLQTIGLSGKDAYQAPKILQPRDIKKRTCYEPSNPRHRSNDQLLCCHFTHRCEMCTTMFTVFTASDRPVTPPTPRPATPRYAPGRYGHMQQVPRARQRGSHVGRMQQEEAADTEHPPPLPQMLCFRRKGEKIVP